MGMCVCVCVCVCVRACVCVGVGVCVSPKLSIYLPKYLSIYLYLKKLKEIIYNLFIFNFFCLAFVISIDQIYYIFSR